MTRQGPDWREVAFYFCVTCAFWLAVYFVIRAAGEAFDLVRAREQRLEARIDALEGREPR